MDFAELTAAFYARGFNFMNDAGSEETRAQRWVNEAYHELCEEADWPFLETIVTGTAPLALTRARNVSSVVNTTDQQTLIPTTQAWVNESYGTIPTGGVPRYWYAVNSATDTITVKTAPAPSGKTLSVVFYQHPADLTGTDDPVVPSRWHYLIVEGAVRRAYQDNDQVEEAAVAEAARQAGLVSMRRWLLNQAPPALISTEFA